MNSGRASLPAVLIANADRFVASLSSSPGTRGVPQSLPVAPGNDDTVTLLHRSPAVGARERPQSRARRALSTPQFERSIRAGDHSISPSPPLGVQLISQPFGIRRCGVLQPEPAHLERNQNKTHQFSRAREQLNEIHQHEIASILLVAGNTFVIVEEAAASVNQSIAVRMGQQNGPGLRRRGLPMRQGAAIFRRGSKY